MISRRAKTWLSLLLLMLGAGFAHAASDYRLGPGDLLKISTFGYNDLAAEVRVSESGNITFPLIGQVPVEGLSTRDAESLIAEKLQSGSFITRAQVSVLIVEYQSQKVSVMGQVENRASTSSTARPTCSICSPRPVVWLTRPRPIAPCCCVVTARARRSISRRCSAATRARIPRSPRATPSTCRARRASISTVKCRSRARTGWTAT